MNKSSNMDMVYIGGAQPPPCRAVLFSPVGSPRIWGNVVEKRGGSVSVCGS